MKKAAFLFFLLILSSNLYSQSPGGVSAGLFWWLKANVGTFTNNGTTAATDGQLVQQWNDQSTIVNHARQTIDANKPTFRTNIINGNPVLRYSTDQFLDALASAPVLGTTNIYMFLVFKQNSYNAGAATDGNGTFIVDRLSATNNLMSFKMVNTDKYMYQKRNDAGGSLGGPVSVTSAPTGIFSLVSYFRNVGVSYGININGKLDATSGGDSETITGNPIRLGRHATTSNAGLDGDIAEVILYGYFPTTTERLKIDSYLAIKYGITLDQTTPTHYLAANSTIVYPSGTSHDLYDNNIAGIARDNTSGLIQAASMSQNTQGIVRIFNPTSLDNGDYLMWGNDAPTIWNSTDSPAPFGNRLSRIWRVAETGEVGNFDISFDLTGLGVDMTDPTKFALLIDGNGVFSDATAHTTGRSIVGNVVTFTGATISTNNYFALASAAIPGPGGVAATTVWLRADEDVYNNAGTTLATNGQTVQQWNTRGGTTAANAIQTTGANKPTYVTGVASANGNPVVRFAGGTQFLDFGTLSITSTSDLSGTMVVRPTTTSGGATNDFAGSYLLDRTANTTSLFSLKQLTGSKFTLQEQSNTGTLDGVSTTTSINTATPQIIDFYRDYSVRFGINYNGAAETTLPDVAGALTFPNLRLGARRQGDNGIVGDVAEFIFYNRDITTVERNRIDSYVALKYGITLDQNAGLQNYTSSDGITIYPAASSHSGFVADIAGIGRDIVSRLVQTNSKSSNANSVVRVHTPSAMTDLEFLVWGDNGGSLTAPTASGVDGTLIKRRLSRVWKVEERGDVGTTTFVFDLTNVPGAKVQADLRMLIDQNNNGFADNDVTPRTGTLAANIFTVTAVNLPDDASFTIGTTNIATTPLPIQLVSFDVALEKTGVISHWETAVEINNDYFTLERSFDGKKFVEALRVDGAGNSQEAHYYEALDNPRAHGTVFYRLKQTDFDGKTAYSEVKKVLLPNIPFFVNLYPNPASSGEFTTELPLETTQVTIQVMNSAGQVVFTSRGNGPVQKWNVGDLPAGIYFVRILSNGGASAHKLVLK